MRRMMNGLHELDDLDDLDDPTEVDYVVDEWFPEDGSNDGNESSSLSLKFRIKNKPLGFI
jgi:hypothetical protein